MRSRKHRPQTDWISALPQGRLLAEYSLWTANLIRLADDLKRITPHADILHIDVADGHFAPALLFFPDLVAGLRALTTIPIHVHRMVDDAVLLAQIDQFAEAGALIAASGKRVGLAAGGLRDTTVPLLRSAGAETVVMGSLAFGAPDLAERMRWLHSL